jgi:hypothetical protein
VAWSCCGTAQPNALRGQAAALQNKAASTHQSDLNLGNAPSLGRQKTCSPPDWVISSKVSNMPKKILMPFGMLLLATAVLAQKETSAGTVKCRVMEVFVAERVGATAVIFHQRDKADGPRLGQLLLAHSGAEVEFQTRDGRWHRAAVVRMRSCFGRGLLLFAASEAKLTPKDDFVLRFQN